MYMYIRAIAEEMKTKRLSYLRFILFLASITAILVDRLLDDFIAAMLSQLAACTCS